MFYLFYFIYGAIVGSFVNVCIYRLPLKESLISPPSHCPACGKTLMIRDLFPILSFFALKGRCRFCREKISPVYPAVECLNGSLYCLCLYHFGFGLKGVIMCLFFSALTAITVIDLKHLVIPDTLNIFIAALGVIGLLLQGPAWYYIAGAFAVSLPIFIIAVITKGFGGGDIKLFFAAGLLLGVKAVCLGGFLAIVLGGVTGMLLLLTKRMSRKSQMPFGPFIAIGIFISSLWCEQIINWYFAQIEVFILRGL